MKDHIENKVYHVEILPPKQDSEDLEKDLALFSRKFGRVMESGYCACITDNAMGLLSFQGSEVIEELGLRIDPERVVIHLNTFHTLKDLHNILDTCRKLGIRYLLVISGDGSERLPKLRPSDLGIEGEVESVTSVELLDYISRHYPGVFRLGAAFNPYEPREHELEKLDRKRKAGASFLVTQPIVGRNEIVDELLKKYPEMPIIVEAWMSKKLDLLSNAVGYEVRADAGFEPVETLKSLHGIYPACGVCLSLLGFQTQYPLLTDTWV